MNNKLARFVFLAAALTATVFAQPVIPVSNISPVPELTLLGRYSTGSGRAQTLGIGSGLSVVGGNLISTGGGGSGNVTASGVLTAGRIIGGAGTSVVVATNLSFSGNDMTVPGNLTIIGNSTFGNLTTATLNVTSNITSTGITNGMLWIGNATGAVFQKGNITAGDGITVTNSAGGIMVNATNTATGNVTAAGTLTSGDFVIGGGSKAVATTSALSITGSNVTLTGNLAVSGNVTGNISGALPAFSGDITTPAGSPVTTLATVNGSPGAFGNATTVPVVTVNAKGLVTSITNATITASGNVTNNATLTSGNIVLGGGTSVIGISAFTPSSFTSSAVVPSTAPSSGQLLVGNAGGTAYAPVSASGDASLASTGAITLGTVNSNVGTFGNATTVAQVTANAKGLTTAVANVAISIPSTAISDSTATGRSVLTAADAAAARAAIGAGTGSGSGNITGPTMTANAVVVGAGTTAIAPLASLGNSGAPLLSGGAGAPPAFGAINLAGGTNIVSGAVPTLNGGLGADNSAATGIPVFASGTATVTTATGTGAPMRGTSPSFTTNLTLAAGASPSTTTAGTVAFDTDAHAASRGAVQVFDGTANTYLVGTLASDTPTNGQVPVWNTGGTITWETPSGSGTVTTSGSPANTYLSRFTTATAITGASDLFYTASGADRILNLNGDYASFNATANSASWYAALTLLNSSARSMELGYTSTSYAGPPMSSGVGGESAFMKTGGAFPIQWGTSNTFRMLLNSSGELQIANTTDLGAYKLQVTGDTLFNGTTFFGTTGNATGQMYNGGALGEMPAGAYYSSTTGNHNIYADGNGVSGSKLSLGYWNGAAWKAAFRVAHTSGGANGVVYLGEGGTTRVVIGTTSDDGSNLLQVNGTIKPLSTSGIVGTTTNNNVAAGSMGEYIESLVAVGSSVSLTTATAANITSISLTAGDWDVDGNVNYSATTATVTGTSGGISSTSATLPTDGSEVYSGVQVTLLSETDSVTLPRKRFSLSGTTTVYLVGKSTFSAGTVGGFGKISARRVR